MQKPQGYYDDVYMRMGYGWFGPGWVPTQLSIGSFSPALRPPDAALYAARDAAVSAQGVIRIRSPLSTP